MRLGVMQPYFFPYMGYFDLIDRTDRWVVFDVVKYTPKTWMNRNRILHPSQGWQYISAPVVHGGADMTIRDARLVDRAAARERALGQIEHYRRRAPHFDTVRRLVTAAFDHAGDDSLTALNVASLAVVCDHLGIAFHPEICSRLDLALPPITHAGQWALEIATALGATAYVNPPGGRDIFVGEEWSARGVELLFTGMPDIAYETPGYGFQPHLSVIDVLMWLTPQDVLARLRSGPEPVR